MQGFRRIAMEEGGRVVVRDPALSNGGVLPTWRTRIEIRVPSLEATLRDFPVLVKLTGDNFDFGLAQADGSDIRFSLKAEPTLEDWLAHEIDGYDGSSLGQIWVKLPLVHAGRSENVFYLFCGNEAAGDYPRDVFSGYEFVLHGDAGSNWLVPLSAEEIVSRSEAPGRRFTVWPIADCRAHFEATDATGLTKADGMLVVEIKCTDPNQLLDSLPDELDGETGPHDHEGYDWIGGVGISSTTLDTGGPIEEWWREGIRDLGLHRQWHTHVIAMSDWINRHSEPLDGQASTYENGTLGNSSPRIIGSGTDWEDDLNTGNRVMVRFPETNSEQIFKVEVIDSDTQIRVQGYAESTIGDNVGVNFKQRTLRLCSNDDELIDDEIRHVRIVGHFRSHNVLLHMRNARLTWPSGATNVARCAAGKHDAQRTDTGNALHVPGLIGAALAFDGGQGRLKLSRQVDFGGMSFTLSFCVKANPTCEEIPILGADDFRCRFRRSGTLYFQFGKYRQNVPIDMRLFNGEWHHVALVRDRALNFFKLWMDGELLATLGDAGADFNLEGFSYLIGSEDPEDTELFDGLVDEVRMIYEAKPESWIKLEADGALASMTWLGEAYRPETAPAGVELSLADGGALYVR